MYKVDQKFVDNFFSCEESINEYSKTVFEIGLWESEKTIFQKYLPKKGSILDVGCGTGRTTFGLYNLGYRNIKGLDLSTPMISIANSICYKFGYYIDFIVGDACKLPYEDRMFDGCLFSLNGLMHIPKKDNRIKALLEINRVLKPGGRFIFTTHDRDFVDEYKEFWENEAKKWNKGVQDKRLHDFGDIIFKQKNASIAYIHIPSRSEILECLEVSGFKHIVDMWRTDINKEPEKVEEYAKPCRFWVVSKHA